MSTGKEFTTEQLQEMVTLFNDRYEIRPGGVWSKNRKRYVDNTTPYRCVTLTNANGERYSTVIHRLVFLVTNGYLPGIVDHINGNPLDNKPENLRAATVSQNSINSKVYKNNSTGYRGVVFDKRVKARPYRAAVNGKQYGPSYATAEEAYARYCELALELHGEFVR